MSDNANTYESLAEHYCPICGKIFFPTPVHVYKASGKLYCSWTCFNRRFKNPSGNRGKENMEVEQLTLNGEHIRYFKSAIEAMEHVDGCPTGMYKACRERSSYKGYLWRYKV